jgi:hypothetical protein
MALVLLENGVRPLDSAAPRRKELDSPLSPLRDFERGSRRASPRRKPSAPSSATCSPARRRERCWRFGAPAPCGPEMGVALGSLVKGL